ncbi:hypothetical protein UFOVP1414_73 [uncultured Caudovirales phage]|uniref:Uncharacterized protein n=1 Tax=uncultured Caudovirales phage TaxID=2100421 RepID=A0A6J5SEH0_9CAUD|nr:hypothetical protein UFOVP442_4 [uncultured Caudovirales phage]CAB4211977.1 hypothetical protein UFOVP1414_73 [uncultured Caudovirales phage]
MSGTFKKALTAWHASPFDIPGGEFAPMRKSSGTGQGAAAYGRGAAYVAESPALSGPGESVYMKEFSQHQAVRKTAKRWHISIDDEWEPLDDSFHDLSSPEAMDEEHRTALDQREAGFNWISNRLSRFNHHSYEGALTQIENSLNQLGDENYAKNMRMEAGMNVDGSEPGYTADHARMVRSGLELAKKKLRFLGDDPSGGPYSYQVALDLSPQTMLDWDNSLEDHHPKAVEKIKSAFSDAIEGAKWETDPFNGLSGKPGEEIYSALQRLHASGYSLKGSIPQHDLKFDASEGLHKAGIRAIRYLDGESRGRFETYKKDLELSRPRYVEEIVGVSPREGAEKKITNPKVLDEITRTLFVKDDVFGRKPEASVQGIISYITDQLRGYHSDHEKIAQYARFLNWIAENQNHIEVKKVTKTLPPLKPVPEKPKNLTYNYVVLDPKFIKTIAQYDIKGEKLQDYGSGVHLHPVDHDPFKGD